MAASILSRRCGRMFSYLSLKPGVPTSCAVAWPGIRLQRSAAQVPRHTAGMHVNGGVGPGVVQPEVASLVPSSSGSAKAAAAQPSCPGTASIFPVRAACVSTLSHGLDRSRARGAVIPSPLTFRCAQPGELAGNGA